MIQKILLGTLVALVALFYTISFTKVTNQDLRVGAGPLGSAGHGTTTNTNFPKAYVLTSCPGELRNVNISVVGTDSWALYDATSTTLGLSYWPDTALFSAGPSQAVGNFNVERIFRQGLMIKFTNNGSTGSTTITWNPSC